MGLQNSTGVVAENAKTALSAIKSAIAAKKDLKIVTAKGNNVTQSRFYKEKLDEYQEDNKKIDDVIIEITQQQGKLRAEMMKSNGVDRGQFQSVVLVTDDRNMRVKSTAKQVPAISSSALRAIISPRTAATSRPKRKSFTTTPFMSLKQRFPNSPDEVIACALADADGNMEAVLYTLTQMEEEAGIKKKA